MLKKKKELPKQGVPPPRFGLPGKKKFHYAKLGKKNKQHRRRGERGEKERDKPNQKE